MNTYDEDRIQDPRSEINRGSTQPNKTKKTTTVPIDKQEVKYGEIEWQSIEKIFQTPFLYINRIMVIKLHYR